MPSTITKALDVRGLQRIGRLPIAASQTFKCGDFLTLNSSGQLQQGLSAGNNLSAWSSGIVNLVVGRAIEDAQPSTNDPTILPATKLYGAFIIAEPGTQFALPICNGASSQGTAAYPNANLLTKQYPLRYCTPADFPTTVTVSGVAIPITTGAASSGASMWAVDISTSTAAVLQIVDWFPDDLNGSTYAGWPDVGQASAPNSGVAALSARAWVEFIGNQCAFTGARSLTRTN